MDKYYYLAASLPLLKFNEQPYLTRDDFISQAEPWLMPRDFLILRGVDIDIFFSLPQDAPFLKQWKEFEYSLRQELGLWRQAKRRNSEYKLPKDLAEIVRPENNPWEIERGLLSLRWNFLDQQEQGHFFDLEFLISYWLKLQLLERLFSFSKKKGKENFAIFSKVEL